MSKLSSETLTDAIEEILRFSSDDKKRRFLESIEIQCGLKNFDVKKEKRFSGSVKLPHLALPKLKICVLADASHSEAAETLGVPFLNIEALKTYNRDKKKVKALASQYDAFLCSQTLIRQIPKLLGPWLNRAGKFPTMLSTGANLANEISDLKSTVKVGIKGKALCLGTNIGHVKMPAEEIELNIRVVVNFLVSLLKKHWQNIKSLHIKSSMGPSHRIY